jgi:hypothetical protein
MKMCSLVSFHLFFFFIYPLAYYPNIKFWPTVKIYSKNLQQPIFHQKFVPVIDIKSQIEKERVKRQKQIKEEIKERSKLTENILAKSRLWFNLCLQKFSYKVLTEKLPTRLRSKEKAENFIGKKIKFTKEKMTCPACDNEIDEETTNPAMNCDRNKIPKAEYYLTPLNWIQISLYELEIKLSKKSEKELEKTKPKLLASANWPKNVIKELNFKLKEKYLKQETEIEIEEEATNPKLSTR